MRKILIALFICLACLLPSLAAADFSEVKTGDALIMQGRGYFLGIVLVTDGTNAVTLNIHDGISTSGKRLIPTDYIISTGASSRVAAIGFSDKDVPFREGIYVDITCSGTVSYIVYFNRQ